MAARAKNFCMSKAIDTFDDTIIAGLAGTMTSEGARALLSLRFSNEQQERMKVLAAKARDGELTSAESREADSFERVSSLLGILQSKSRVTLRNTIR